MRIRRLAFIIFATTTLGIVCLSLIQGLQVAPDSTALGPGTGAAQLVSIREFPDYGTQCSEPPTEEAIAASRKDMLLAALRERTVYAQGGKETTDVTRPPVRTIRDTYPTYSYVAVDPLRDEVVLQDNNLWSISVFDRRENTAAGSIAKPKRLIKGPKTDIQFNNGVYIDPENGDIYSVESDTGDKVVVFGHEANGDVEPKRILNTPHRGFALDVDEEKQELYVSVQYPPEVAVYRKDASGDDKPLRSLQGESTRLSDTHGMFVDVKNKLMYVNNWGHISDYLTAGTGRMEDPSIAVYPMDAAGDAAPIRVIQGSRTQLNWPGGMAFDPDTQEIYVANDVGHSILVFHAADQGNVAPRRVIKGGKTGLLNPTGIDVDLRNKELWVANFGNSTATVYPLKANGDVAPIRTVRSAPAGYQGLKFGKVEAIAYDTKRQEYLVPNCVSHPQIAAFPRLSKENERPVRTLEGQNTLISRTMHGLSYDAVHDELVVPSPLAQAILVFRGGAGGEEAPVRYIQGPLTQIVGTGRGALDTVTVDGVNSEIYLPVASNSVLVFDRMAQGNVAPKRILTGPDTQIAFPQPFDEGPIPPVAVDTRRNLLVVKSAWPRGSAGKLVIFERTARGNARPLRVIGGPKSGLGGGAQLAITPTGFIVGGAANGAVGAWHIDDNGDVPPRYRIPMRQVTGLQFNGLDIDVVNKEVIVPTGNGNHVYTFYFPELF